MKVFSSIVFQASIDENHTTIIGTAVIYMYDSTVKTYKGDLLIDKITEAINNRLESCLSDSLYVDGGYRLLDVIVTK